MRTVRWSMSTVMVLASATVAAAQETQKVLLQPAGAPTLEYRVVGQQEAQKPEPAAAQPIHVKEARVTQDEPEKLVGSLDEQLAKVHLARQTKLQADDAAVLSEIVRFRAAASNDPHRDVILRLRSVATESCTQCHAGGVSVKKDEALGLTLVPADETLRSQLKLEKTGLVVTEVAKGSSGEASGIKEKDILVALADKPLGDVESFKAALGDWAKPAAPLPGSVARPTQKPIAVKVIRAGEPREVRVAPPAPPTLIVGRITNAPEPTTAPSYWIGVSIDQVDDTLRSHLKLGDGVGLVVTDVLKGSPAEKSGLKKDDVLFAIDGTPLKSPEDMIKAVQASKGEKTISLTVRRAGDPYVFSVRPEKRADAPETTRDVKPREIRITADGQHPAWVAQVLPFIDNHSNQAFAYTMPGQQGQYWLSNAPYTIQGGPVTVPILPNALGQQAQAEAERKKAVEAEQKAIETMQRELHAHIQRINARLPEQSEWKAVVESLKKTAPPAESLAKIDAQLRALEAQVGEIKRSVEELKGAVKREK